MNREKIMQTLRIVTLGLILSVGVGYALAGPPTASPPGGNTAPPINVGTAPQDKNGVLGVTTLKAFSQVIADEFCLGTDCITQWPTGGGLQLAGSSSQTIRHNGTNWEASSLLKNTERIVTVQRTLIPCGSQQDSQQSFIPQALAIGTDSCDPAPNADVFRALANVEMTPGTFLSLGLKVLGNGNVKVDRNLNANSIETVLLESTAVVSDSVRIKDPSNVTSWDVNLGGGSYLEFNSSNATTLMLEPSGPLSTERIETNKLEFMAQDEIYFQGSYTTAPATWIIGYTGSANAPSLNFSTSNNQTPLKLNWDGTATLGDLTVSGTITNKLTRFVPYSPRLELINNVSCNDSSHIGKMVVATTSISGGGLATELLICTIMKYDNSWKAIFGWIQAMSYNAIIPGREEHGHRKLGGWGVN